MPYGVRILIFFLFFRRQGFRMIIFDRQAGPLQNFNRSYIMVIGRSVLFSDPARPPGGGVGRPKIPLPSVSEPQLKNSTPGPPPPHPHLHAPRPVLRTLTPILVQ